MRLSESRRMPCPFLSASLRLTPTDGTKSSVSSLTPTRLFSYFVQTIFLEEVNPVLSTISPRRVYVLRLEHATLYTFHETSYRLSSGVWRSSLRCMPGDPGFHFYKDFCTPSTLSAIFRSTSPTWDHKHTKYLPPPIFWQ